ncbi:MAG: MoaD family protein [Chloroflexi bacterium]|nr:MoaD family protein [Chloroflexota bacterium]
MSVEVRVTAVLQRVVGGEKAVRGEGATVTELLENLERTYPGFKAQIMTEEGQLHRFVNIYKNDEDIRYLGQLETPLTEGDVVSILPALAGGAWS